MGGEGEERGRREREREGGRDRERERGKQRGRERGKETGRAGWREGENGEIGKFTNIEWNIRGDYATVDYWIYKNWMTNIEESIS